MTNPNLDNDPVEHADAEFARNSGYNPDFARRVRFKRAMESGQRSLQACVKLPPVLRKGKMLELLQEAPRAPGGRTPRGVVKWVCDYWGVPAELVIGEDKSLKAQLARQHAMRDLWLIFGGAYSNVHIGAIMQRDHTAVARAVQAAGYKHNARPGGRSYSESPLVQEDPGCAEGSRLVAGEGLCGPGESA